jgi:thioredoxin 1
MSSFNEIINSDTPILVDFHATWCGPCKTMSPILDQVKNQLGTSARILKIDVDKNQTLANKYSVRGVPTLILFKKGEIVWRQSGVVDGKSLIKKIEENI